MQNDKPENPCQVALQLNQDEADALLNLLLCAPETDEVSEEMASQLLRRIAEAQRALLRPTARDTIESGHEEPGAPNQLP
jgi:predicted transcriptional regulator